MKNTLQKQIEKLFESGEIQTITLRKTGRITVKFKKEPHLVTYPKNENNLQYIMEDAKMRESLEPVVMKPKVKVDISQDVYFNTYEVKWSKTVKRKSLFERFYDNVSYWLGGGKSFAPNELKTFR